MKTKLFNTCLLTILVAMSAFSQKAPEKTARQNTDPMTIGERAPDFTLNDETGKAVTLSKLKQPVVLVFYRGYW